MSAQEIEPKEKLIEIRQEKLQERVTALTVIKTYVDTLDDTEIRKNLRAALVVIRPSLYGEFVGRGRRAGPSKHMLLTDFIRESKSVSELDLFIKFKFGKQETFTLLRMHLKTAKPEDRVWIEFDDKTETYELRGTGINAPTNWGGFVPVEQTENIVIPDTGSNEDNAEEEEEEEEEEDEDDIAATT